MTKLIWGLFGFLVAILVAAHPVISKDAGQVFKVATEPTFPPFEMQAKTGDGLEGFDIDLMDAIGKEAGLSIQYESLPFDGIIPALQSGTVDAAISSMTITQERAKNISFSRPYFKAGLAIAVRENNSNIKNLEDLQGKTIAVQIGTTGANQATKIAQAQIITFDNAPLALQELMNGRVDAVVNDAPVTLYAIKQGNLSGIKIVSQVGTEEYYGIALPKNSPYLPVIDKALTELIQKGNYQKIYQKWFPGKPPQLPKYLPALTPEKAAPFEWKKLLENLFKGAIITVTLSLLAASFGMIGGTLLALAMLSPYRLLRWFSRIYVDFFRGTPMLVQIFIIYFGLPALFKDIGLEFGFERFPAAVLALSLNVTAYLGEIVRGGIQSIDRGQWEAAQSLGMKTVQTLRHIILPQALRRMLPPLGNEFITLIKDTSLVAVIGVEELFRQGQLIVATSYKAFEIYITVALVYLILTTFSSLAFRKLENQMKK
jgi:arginine/lysine/histidine/glutamine transport system substrate-binding/permease protein